MKFSDIKIKIHEFGPIKEQEITLAPLMLFTGESNLGKSYINYLCYYFFFSLTENRWIEYIEQCIAQSNTPGQLSLSVHDITFWLGNEAQSFFRQFLGYENLICNVEFEFSTTPGIWQISYSKKEAHSTTAYSNKQQIQEDNGWIQVNINDGFSTISNQYLSIAPLINKSIGSYLIHKLFEEKLLVRNIILPPARGAYVGESYLIKERVANNVSMYRQFLYDYDYATTLTNLSDDNPLYELAIKQLLGGELISENNRQYLVLHSGQRIPLSATASSIKELSPLLFLLKNHSQKNFSICIEEPEAHLHPHMQTDVANLLAAILNKGSLIQLTTHSDYFLQRINQLIKLGYIRKKNPEQFEQICNERRLSNHFYLEKEMIAAYYFEQDEQTGKSKIIKLKIDEKEGMPLSTFFDTIQELGEREQYLNEIINGNEAYGNHEE